MWALQAAQTRGTRRTTKMITKKTRPRCGWRCVAASPPACPPPGCAFATRSSAQRRPSWPALPAPERSWSPAQTSRRSIWHRRCGVLGGCRAYGRARSRIKGEGNFLALFKVRPVVHHAIAAAGEKVLVYNVSLGPPIQEVRCSLKSLSRKCSRGGVREQATA